MRQVAPGEQGMSLRDYFAAAALTGLLVTTGMKAAGGDLTSGEDESICNDARTCGWGSPATNGLQDENGKKLTWLEIVSGEAYEFADAMLCERDRTPDAAENPS